MLRTSDLDFELPESCVATHPAQPRDAAKLMVVAKGSPEVGHSAVGNLPEHLGIGDLLVVNTSRVIPARVLGCRADTGGKAEGLVLGFEATGAPGDPPGTLWRVMIKVRRMKPGAAIALDGTDGSPSGIALRMLRRSGEEGEEGAWVCAVEGAHDGESPIAILDRIGHVPLPPYIRAARRRSLEPDELAVDRDQYQCVYADAARSGSVAAPTAGLHFTPELLARLDARGFRRAEVVLHVGTGTFKPVETEYVEQHPMHAEWCELPASTARAIVETRARGGRVIAVGTTSARTLESFGPAAGLFEQGAAGWSKILITPGHAWTNVDGLMTNFHLPRSTLLALVGAMLGEQGVPRLLELYREAIGRGYRFYSYGDAMLIR